MAIAPRKRVPEHFPIRQDRKALWFFQWSHFLKDLPSPAEASSQNDQPCQGFAQAGNP
jgi:hypothetical protein